MHTERKSRRYCHTQHNHLIFNQWNHFSNTVTFLPDAIWRWLYVNPPFCLVAPVNDIWPRLYDAFFYLLFFNERDLHWEIFKMQEPKMMDLHIYIYKEKETFFCRTYWFCSDLLQFIVGAATVRYLLFFSCDFRIDGTLGYSYIFSELRSFIVSLRNMFNLLWVNWSPFFHLDSFFFSQENFSIGTPVVNITWEAMTFSFILFTTKYSLRMYT